MNTTLELRPLGMFHFIDEPHERVSVGRIRLHRDLVSLKRGFWT